MDIIKSILKRKQWYEILVWTYVKQKKKPPQELNDLLDLIEYIENGKENRNNKRKGK